jgi:hypothetical protein
MPKQLNSEQFKKFFDDLVNVAGKAKGDQTLMEVMETHGMKPGYLPAPLEKQIMPMLTTPMSKVAGIAHNCKACSACSVCSACGELNYAAGGAVAASIWHILDVRATSIGGIAR